MSAMRINLSINTSEQIFLRIVKSIKNTATKADAITSFDLLTLNTFVTIIIGTQKINDDVITFVDGQVIGQS